jgi:hypothetical protein
VHPGGTLENIRAMDNDQQVRLIQGRLDALEEMPVNDDPIRTRGLHARDGDGEPDQRAVSEGRAQAMMGAGASEDEILERLREWLDRLVSALPRIVEKLAGATAFSISSGANVAVTVDFGPSAGSSAKGMAGA